MRRTHFRAPHRSPLPMYFDARQQLAIAIDLHQAGKMREAVTLYREILSRDPNNAAALNAMGMAAAQSNQFDHAATLIARAVELAPNDAAFLNNLGIIRTQQKQLDQAEACWRKAISLAPDYFEPMNSLALLMAQQDNTEEAIQLFRRAAQIQPNNPITHRNLASALRNEWKFREAEAVCLRAAELDPDDTQNLNDLGDSILQQGRAIEAAQVWRRATAEHPTRFVLRNNLLLTLHYDPNITNEELQAEHLSFGADLAKEFPRVILPPRDRDPARPIRVGYVSPYFCRHAVATFVEPILRSHDHSQFIITCYADSRRKDDLTTRCKGFADAWHDTATLSTNELTDLVLKNRDDILVDLTGHISGSRLPVFARKPAPIQVTYLGYQNTTGLDAMDYRITDAAADPPGIPDRFYTERLVRLPCFFCYQPPDIPVEVGPLPAMKNDYVTFGSMNTPAKLNERVIALWSPLMKQVERSRITLLINEPGEGDDRFMDMFAENGIDNDRVNFVGRSPKPKYLELFNEIDIGLDPLPFSGHTTTCDALWMGVPVVTLAGDRYASRMTTSVLEHLGAPEWIAQTPDEYVKIASALAGDLSSLSQIRSGLRQRLETSTIADDRTFTRNLEAAYRRMWVDWCNSQ